MLVQCTQCSKTLKVPDTAAGKRIRCPACSTVVDVPLNVSTTPSTSGSGAAVQNPAAGSPPIRKARAVSSESRNTADAGPSASGGGSKAASSSPVSRETSSRGSSSSSSQSRDAVRSGRGTPARSTSSQRPRKQSRPVEQDDDDFGYGSYEDDGADYFESNPFAPPRSSAGVSSARSGGQDEISSRRLAGLGLLIQGWATVSIFLSIVFIVVASFIAAAMERGGGAGSQGLLILIGFAAIGMFVAAIVVLVGECICIAIPPRSGAKGLIIAAICCLAAQVVVGVIQTLTDQGTSNPFRPSPFQQGPSAGQLLVALIGFVTGLGHLICFELFLKKASEYMRRDDLARQAMTILIGIPSCTVLIFVCSFLAPILARTLAPVMGLVMLAPILAAGIAMIVFAVMHVSLLFRVGWALRS
jgi:phage FluMu protein Com